MKEERMAILRMVAEGKISADEAETLLQALGSSQPEPGPRRRSERRQRGKRSWNWPVDVEHMVEETVGFVDDVVESFEKEFSFFDKEFDSSPQTVQISAGTTLVVKAQSGNINLIGTDSADLQISGAVRWQYKVEREKQVVQVKAKHFGANLTVHVPTAVSQIIVKSHLGQVIGRGLGNQLKDIQIKTQTGNIALELGTITEGRILLKSQVGQIKLRLPKESTAEVRAATHHMGDIETNLPLTKLERGSGYLKGMLNDGGADIRLATHTGGIMIEAS
jgi:DUF4097 and DUF4098 domain-containing protein YvlB